MTDDDVHKVNVPADESIPGNIDHAKVLGAMRVFIDTLNSENMNAAESFALLSSLFLSIIATIPREHRWDARARMISMLLRASVAQDSAVNILDQPEAMQ